MGFHFSPNVLFAQLLFDLSTLGYFPYSADRIWRPIVNGNFRPVLPTGIRHLTPVNICRISTFPAFSAIKYMAIKFSSETPSKCQPNVGETVNIISVSFSNELIPQQPFRRNFICLKA